MSVREVTSAELKELQGAGNRLLIDVWAPWCGPCKTMSPRLEEVANQLGGLVTIVKVNAEVERELCSKLSVTSLPTLLVFQGETELRRSVGSKSVKEVVDLITR